MERSRLTGHFFLQMEIIQSLCESTCLKKQRKKAARCNGLLFKNTTNDLAKTHHNTYWSNIIHLIIPFSHHPKLFQVQLIIHHCLLISHLNIF